MASELDGAPPQRPPPAAYRIVTDPATIGEPLLRSLTTYWTTKRKDGRLPSRSDVDVLELRPFMGSLFLFDVIDQGRDFRFRLIGTNLVARFGRDSTGKTFSQAYHDADAETATWLHGIYARVATKAVPIWSRAPLRQVARDFIIATAIHLPLSADGATVNMILGASVFTTQRS